MKRDNDSLEIKPATGHNDDSQEPMLQRNFSVVSVLGACVSLMATWEAICSTMAAGLIAGGTNSLVYGFIVAFIGTVCTAVSFSEAASIWISVFAWIVFTASAPFLAGTMIQGQVVLNYESYEPQRWQGTLIYWAVLLIALPINIFGQRILPWIETLSMILHVGLFFVLLIAMLVLSPAKQSAEAVFATFENNSGWQNDGVAWFIGLLSSSYVLAGYDAATHLSEEMQNPAVGVPVAIVGSILINGVVGFSFLIAILFSTQDFDLALASPTGFPILEIFRQTTRGSVAGATAMSSAIVLMATLATIPLMATAARMVWAFARDQGLPWSSGLSKIPESESLRVPLASILVITVILMLLGLLNIASTAAFNAILGVSVVGLYISYLIPLVLLLYQRVARPKELNWGPWRLNNVLGCVVNCVAIIYTTVASIFSLFPPTQPVTAENMNYASVVLAGAIVTSGIYWLAEGHKSFHGPAAETIHGVQREAQELHCLPTEDKGPQRRRDE
ncbi:amino acid/polyamine transporter I [Xylaria arbuscula]|nr:amino acid/polyamine transporter I [Xylaria arbuscula]